jgi:cytoskeleton protein RodZ
VKALLPPRPEKIFRSKRPSPALPKGEAGDVSLQAMAQTIGQQLKQARLEGNLTIEQIVQTTRVRGHYIEAIEADDYEALPSPVQARAFLRIYAKCLGMSLDELIARQASETGLTENKNEGLSSNESQGSTETSATAIEEGLPRHVPKKIKGIFRQAKSSPLNGQFPPEERASGKEEAGSENAADLPEMPGKETVEESASPPEMTAPPKELPPSQVIFANIGQALQQRREALSLTLEEIERNTHVRTHYLQALERGDFDHLPSSVQARGMLNNVVRFLDMDGESILLQFAEGLQALRLERQPQPVEENQIPSKKTRNRIAFPPAFRRYLSMDILVGGGLVTLLVIFAIWGTSRIIGLRGASTPQPAAPSISDVLIATPETTGETPSPTGASGNGVFPVLETGTPMVPAVAIGPGVVHVVVVGLNSAWVRVVVDQKIAFEGRITAGSAYPYDGNSQIEVLTGNGAAVSILYNQSNLGPLGSLGEVVDHIYTADAILNPTPTFTPSPTITPVPSKTLRPSATLRPSLTPRSSLTPTH